MLHATSYESYTFQASKPMLVALSEEDELNRAPAVLRHVTELKKTAAQQSPGNLPPTEERPAWMTVLWWPRWSHTEFMFRPSAWKQIAQWADAQP